MNRARVSGFVAGALSVLSASSAFAFGEDTPCGPFVLVDEDSPYCEILDDGGCLAQCTPLAFQAATRGLCTAPPEEPCADTCGASCLAACEPVFDCFDHCHGECDSKIRALCEAEDTEAECEEQAQAQCRVHCESACEIDPPSCEDSCAASCDGACQAQSNFECDFARFAELAEGCEAACPTSCEEQYGAIFCDGQLVDATDVIACAEYLGDQGIEVEVSLNARLCEEEGDDPSGCGCAVQANNVGAGAAVGLASLVGLSMIRSRRRTRKHR